MRRRTQVVSAVGAAVVAVTAISGSAVAAAASPKHVTGNRIVTVRCLGRGKTDGPGHVKVVNVGPGTVGNGQRTAPEKGLTRSRVDTGKGVTTGGKMLPPPPPPPGEKPRTGCKVLGGGHVDISKTQVTVVAKKLGVSTARLQQALLQLKKNAPAGMLSPATARTFAHALGVSVTQARWALHQMFTVTGSTTGETRN